MKILLLSTLFSLSCFIAIAQKTFKYYNPEHFKGYGIVFTKEYKLSISLRDFDGQFTPKKEEIDSAEAIFVRRYDADINRRELYISTNNPVKFYKHYLRQYVGLMNFNGEKLVLIKMLKIPRPRSKNTRYYYQDWESQYILGTGEFYEKNTVPFIINLRTKDLKVF